MNPTLLADMLASRPEVKLEGDVFSPAEEASLALLLNSNGGPVPLSKVKHLRLGEQFITAETVDATFVLPYSALAGLRVEATQAGRPGFRR